MYLMNVPPFAATHTEWRTCGPPQDFSLHGLHSSDSELSTGDANIKDKVQMIIKSLRSTQSSNDMGDDIAGNVPSGQEIHLEACKFGLGPLVGSKLSIDSATETRQTQSVIPVQSENQDSDSDDSVDRGIEEAILEYLKEKDGHKRIEEPSTNILQQPKVHRKHTLLPDICKQHSDSKIVLSASNPFAKIAEAETLVAPVQRSLTKNDSLNPTPFKENAVKKIEKSMTTKSVLSKEPKNIAANDYYKKVKKESDSLDSSSDDGIEEAIQKYQLEKKDKQTGSKSACNSFTSQNLSDSSSDDGIEEAILCYQREQLKEKSVLKPFMHKQRPRIRSPIQSLCRTNTEKVKKIKSKKKSKNKNMQSGPPLSSVPFPQSTLFGSSNSNGNGTLLFKDEPLKLHSPTTTKTTSAELLCAEAILDISKAVMPAAFSATVGMNFNTNETLSAPCTTVDESSESSIDSEDGIEQEIRMFLEQKAQLQKQPQTTAMLSSLPFSLNEPDKAKGKPELVQKKVLRLSLTQRRKQKSQDCKKTATSPNKKDELTLKEDREGSNTLCSYPLELSPSSVEFDKTEQEGDKSSSLDSDEDLDTAIKDLLKTKMKLKRKTRDLKLKSRKCLKDPEPCDNSPAKRQKLNPVSKRGVWIKTPPKIKETMSEKTEVSRNTTSPQRQNMKKKDHGGAGESEQPKMTGCGSVLLCTHESAAQQTEDSSSVDSDDSIEQEIRKFLAEKAKVTPSETKNNDDDGPIYGSIGALLPEKAITLESQPAEIPTPENHGLPDNQSPVSCNDTPSSLAPLHIGATCHPSLFSRSPSLLHYMGGDGIVKQDELMPTIGSGNANLEKTRTRPASGPSVAQPFSDAMKWRQSLGLPINNTRPAPPRQPSSPFNSLSVNEKTSAATPFHRSRIDPKTHTPLTIWTPARSSPPVLPISHYPETLNSMSSSVLNPFSAAKHSLGRSPMMGLSSGGLRLEKPLPGQKDSENCLAPSNQHDRGAFTRQDPTSRSCQVWVQGRPFSGGRPEERTSRGNEEREVIVTAEKAVQSVKMEVEDFVDETDCELDERRDAGKTQGVSLMSQSRAIDPGLSLKPYIALNTEERDNKFPRRYRMCQRSKNKTMEHVKRKLTFVQVPRKESSKRHTQLNRP